MRFCAPGLREEYFQLERFTEQLPSHPDTEGPQVGKGKEAGSGSESPELTARLGRVRAALRVLEARVSVWTARRVPGQSAAPGRRGGVQPECSVRLEALWAEETPSQGPAVRRQLSFGLGGHRPQTAGLDLRRREPFRCVSRAAPEVK